MSAEESPFAAAPEAAAAPEGVAEEEAEPLDAQYDQTNMPPVDFPSPAAEQEDPIQKLLREKDAEIASLKQAILHQHKEIKRLKKGVRTDQPEDLKAASIEGIANQVIAAKPSKIELRWKKRFQELVAYKLEVCRNEIYCVMIIFYNVVLNAVVEVFYKETRLWHR